MDSQTLRQSLLKTSRNGGQLAASFSRANSLFPSHLLNICSRMSTVQVLTASLCVRDSSSISGTSFSMLGLVSMSERRLGTRGDGWRDLDKWRAVRRDGDY